MHLRQFGVRINLAASSKSAERRARHATVLVASRPRKAKEACAERARTTLPFKKLDTYVGFSRTKYLSVFYADLSKSPALQNAGARLERRPSKFY
jgi:hypothetical protein